MTKLVDYGFIDKITSNIIESVTTKKDTTNSLDISNIDLEMLTKEFNSALRDSLVSKVERYIANLPPKAKIQEHLKLVEREQINLIQLLQRMAEAEESGYSDETVQYKLSGNKIKLSDVNYILSKYDQIYFFKKELSNTKRCDKVIEYSISIITCANIIKSYIENPFNEVNNE